MWSADVRVHAFFSQAVTSASIHLPTAPQFFLKLKAASGLLAVRLHQLLSIAAIML